LAELAQGHLVAGRYRLDRRIGEGGMAFVWAATHQVTGKAVALKFLKPPHAFDPRDRHRFLREARAACAVHHPNVVEIDDVLELEDGSPVMVMDLLVGETLGYRLLREGALPLEQTARILLPVVSAVGTAHALGIVHRDLKPDNIYLAQAGAGHVDVKVLDFGIAKVTAIEGSTGETGNLTGSGMLLGTPFYMSPEQVFGERDIDQRSDVWSLGVILYECLSGRRPTQSENLGQVIKIITTESIPGLASVVKGLPAEVGALVDRMLSRRRESRPQSLSEVREVLARYSDVSVPSFGEPAKVRSSLPAGNSVSRAAPLADTVLEGEEVPSLHAVSPVASTLGESRDVAKRRSARGYWAAGLALGVAGVFAAGYNTFGTAHAPAASPASSGVVERPPAPSLPPSSSLATSDPPALSASASSKPAPSSSASPPKPKASGTPSAHPSSAPSAPGAPTPTASAPGGIIEKPNF
jgi:eukaryotic-like serine/threonine-protein kinase